MKCTLLLCTISYPSKCKGEEDVGFFQSMLTYSIWWYPFNVLWLIDFLKEKITSQSHSGPVLSYQNPFKGQVLDLDHPVSWFWWGILLSLTPYEKILANVKYNHISRGFIWGRDIVWSGIANKTPRKYSKPTCPNLLGCDEWQSRKYTCQSWEQSSYHTQFLWQLIHWPRHSTPGGCHWEGCCYCRIWWQVSTQDQALSQAW